MLLIMYRYVGYSKLAILTILVEMLRLAIIQFILEESSKMLLPFDIRIVRW